MGVKFKLHINGITQIEGLENRVLRIYLDLRAINLNKTREKAIIRSSIICTLQ
jgi:hypothetical protein